MATEKIYRMIIVNDITVFDAEPIAAAPASAWDDFRTEDVEAATPAYQFV